MKIKKILVIGGEGYIGNILTENLLSKGYEVISYDNLIYKNGNTILSKINKPGYSFFYGDMCTFEKNTKLLKEVDAVVLLAGLVGDPITKKYPEESASINDNGVRKVIDVCSKEKIKKFIFISTCSNYGLIEDNQLADEEFILNPLSSYAKSKIEAEKYLLSLKGKTEMNPTILRFATAFGLSPRMRFDLTISEFTRNLALGKELLVYDADTWRPYCHVQDFSRLIEMVLQAPTKDVAFQVFNSGGDINNSTKKMLIDEIIKIIPDAKVKFQKHGSDPRNYRVSFVKVKQVLDFEPQFSIQDGIKELLEALKLNIFKDVQECKNFYGNYEIDYKQ